jgi:hypothetical protein
VRSIRSLSPEEERAALSLLRDNLAGLDDIKILQRTFLAPKRNVYVTPADCGFRTQVIEDTGFSMSFMFISKRGRISLDSGPSLTVRQADVMKLQTIVCSRDAQALKEHLQVGLYL